MVGVCALSGIFVALSFFSFRRRPTILPTSTPKGHNASLLLENHVLIKLDGIFSEEGLWQKNGQYIALAKWPRSEGKYTNHKVYIFDLQIGEFEESIFIKHFIQFKATL